jgi:hypothetical protein
VVPNIQLMPVIHARAAQLGVVDLETKGVDQMEHAARDCAHPADVTRVRGNLRVE